MSVAQAKTEQYLSVSELVELLNSVLSEAFPALAFEGEISQFKVSTGGHYYFTVKDKDSQVECVIWKGMTGSLAFKPAAGMAVHCRGRPSVWRGSGKLQIVVTWMTPVGEGLLQKKFLELKAKLESEGLFSPERKRPIPTFPRAVGIITSPTGAVIEDIKTTVKRRMPQLQLYLVPVKVQGEGSAQEVAQALALLNQGKTIDVIIVARGGGSLEDLWAFNEELVVRAIYASRIPVISAIGHETDTTLADLVADRRAPTPSIAAEFVSPERSKLLARVEELQQRLQHYERWFEPLLQRLDELSMRMESRVENLVEGARLKLATLQARVEKIAPARLLATLTARVSVLAQRLAGYGLTRIEQYRRRVDGSQQRLTTVSLQFVERRRAVLDRLHAQLEAASPTRTLARGYSIVRSGDRVVASASEVNLKDHLAIQFAVGSVETEVISVEKGK